MCCLSSVITCMILRSRMKFITCYRQQCRSKGRGRGARAPPTVFFLYKMLKIKCYLACPPPPTPPPTPLILPLLRHCRTRNTNKLYHTLQCSRNTDASFFFSSFLLTLSSKLVTNKSIPPLCWSNTVKFMQAGQP